MTAVHRIAVAAASGPMEVKHDLVYRADGTAHVVSEDDVLLIKAEPMVTGPGTVVIQSNGLVSVSTSAGTILAQQQQQINNGNLSNGPFSGLGNNSGSPASSKPRRPAAPDNDWLSSPSPSGGAPSLTPSPGPPSHAFTVISNGYSSPLSSGSYDPYSPNGKIGIPFPFEFDIWNLMMTVTRCLFDYDYLGNGFKCGI
ncbi:unnamed protein product [Ceutorhynchus assimilis]|uniref:Uncharacterized protein n=1 Tax=Ceutorhynchus assimilis TaxID=467358 RepID=A0A9N9MDE3_9CUCU|nr:unnamed protein product [Ceutorhynchus assimilis]